MYRGLVLRQICTQPCVYIYIYYVTYIYIHTLGDKTSPLSTKPALPFHVSVQGFVRIDSVCLSFFQQFTWCGPFATGEVHFYRKTHQRNCGLYIQLKKQHIGLTYIKLMKELLDTLLWTTKEGALHAETTPLPWPASFEKPSRTANCFWDWLKWICGKHSLPRGFIAGLDVNNAGKEKLWETN